MDGKQAPTRITAVVVSKRAGKVCVDHEWIERPSPGPGQLLIRPAFVGICGSDLEQLADHLPPTFQVTYPHVLGHEWSGEVLEVGVGVEDFQPGDRLIGHGDLGDNRWFGVTHDGAMAEAFAVDASVCFRVPDSIELRTAAVVEPFACVFAAFRKLGTLNASHRVHVHGLGAIGLCAVIQAVASGATVTAVDPSARRRELALSLGAETVVDTGDAVGLAALAGTADVVIEASGAPPAQAAALESADHHGRVVMMGVSKPRAVPAALGLIQQRDLSVFSSTGAPRDAWGPALRMLERLRLDLQPLVSATFPFTHIDEALARAADPGRETKVLVHP